MGAVTTATSNPYLLHTPCRNCPFRADLTPYLRPERAAEIARGIADGATFTCHKTTVAVETDEGDVDMVDGPRAQQCAGATITLLKSGLVPQPLRIAERLGMIDVDALDMDAPVHDSLDAWVRSYREDDGAVLEHCGVVGPDCEDPAGYMMGGGAMANPDPPTCDPEQCCGACGSTMCTACRGDDVDGDPRCVHCAGDDEDDWP